MEFAATWDWSKQVFGQLSWLIANVKDFGFSWEVVPSEPWHLRYVCGDNPPPAVVSFVSGAL